MCTSSASSYTIYWTNPQSLHIGIGATWKSVHLAILVNWPLTTNRLCVQIIEKHLAFFTLFEISPFINQTCNIVMSSVFYFMWPPALDDAWHSLLPIFMFCINVLPHLPQRWTFLLELWSLPCQNRSVYIVHQYFLLLFHINPAFFRWDLKCFTVQ